MNCPPTEQWDLLATEALDEQSARPLLAHLLECPECRSAHERARRAHLDRIRMYDQLDRGHDSLREQLMSALPPQPVRSRADRLVRGWRHTGDFAMTVKNRFGARATIGLVSIAACLLVAFLAITFGTGRSAFASAIERFQKARTIVCRISATTPAAPGVTGHETVGKMYVSAEYGSRCEMFLNSTAAVIQYMPAQGPMTSVTPLTRTFTVVDVAAMDPARRGANAPDGFLLALSKLKGEASRELGRQTVNGVTLIGYEIAGQVLGLGSAEGIRSELWIDAATYLPVRYIAEMPMPEAAGPGIYQITYDQFEWDTPLDPKLFVPDIPEGYTRLDARMPAADEAALVNALRNYQELTGKYPPALNTATMVTDFSAALGRHIATEMARGGKAPDQKALMQKAMDIGAGIVFYQKLVTDGRSPEYFGTTVKSDQPDAVLVRWRPAPGQLRVIYGDLRIETVVAP